jgi:hypothetical protein
MRYLTALTWHAAHCLRYNSPLFSRTSLPRALLRFEGVSVVSCRGALHCPSLTGFVTRILGADGVAAYSWLALYPLEGMREVLELMDRSCKGAVVGPAQCRQPNSGESLG